VIRIRDLSLSYGNKVVLDGLDLDIPLQGVTCLRGPSGCGKTTLLRLICGLTEADSGEIRGNTGRFSAVFQEDRLLESLSAEKNVLLTAAPCFSRADARQLLADLGIDDPGSRVRDFSGGMRRRVAIARALAADYDVLLLDEPFTGLDAESRVRCLEIIQKMTAQRTVICVTHLRDDAVRLGGPILDFTETED